MLLLCFTFINVFYGLWLVSGAGVCSLLATLGSSLDTARAGPEALWLGPREETNGTDWNSLDQVLRAYAADNIIRKVNGS
jgi:hypothetical protein